MLRWFRRAKESESAMPPPDAGASARLATSDPWPSPREGSRRLDRPILADLVGEADRVVVVDTETTGIYPSDRVVEIAAVTLDVWGNVIDRWETLVNPERDVGPTCIHGITAAMLVHAPIFEDIAGALATRLHGAAIAAHNLPFDRRMLMGEFGRIGLAAELGTGLDTLWITGGRLSVVCARYGIPLSNAHCALHDALATAQLLICVASRLHGPSRPAQMPSGLVSIARVVRRQDLVDPMASKVPDPPFLAELAAQLDHATETDPATVAYLDVLDRALEPAPKPPNMTSHA